MVATIEPMRAADVADVLSFAAGLTRARLDEELARPWARLRIARDPATSRVVGFMLCWNVADELHVLDIVVHPDARRRGIGRALMQDALDEARTRGAANLHLEVRRSNDPAIWLYRSLGFYALDVRVHYYPDGEDAIAMTLALDPATGRVVAKKDEIAL